MFDAVGLVDDYDSNVINNRFINKLDNSDGYNDYDESGLDIDESLDTCAENDDIPLRDPRLDSSGNELISNINLILWKKYVKDVTTNVNLDETNIQQLTNFAIDVLGYTPIEINKRCKDITGLKSGRLITLFPVYKTYDCKIRWLCYCSCGNFTMPKTAEITANKIQSCGCLNSEATAKRSAYDLAGKIFGNLTVLRRTDQIISSRSIVWECRCNFCGNITYASSSELVRGDKFSCGCRNPKKILENKLVGNRFGKIVVKGVAQSIENKIYYRCICDCGKEFESAGSNIIRGRVQSCGCGAAKIASDRLKIHGLSGTRPYHIWFEMLERCNNPECAQYANYGKLGVKVCKEWHTFEVFYAWLQKSGYRDDLSIDRLNTFSDYSPDNCAWRNRKEQANNQRRHWFNILSSLSQSVLKKVVLSYHQDLIFALTKSIFVKSYWTPIFHDYTGNRVTAENEQRLKQYITDYLASVYKIYEYTLAVAIFHFEGDQPDYPITSWKDEPQPNLSYEYCVNKIDDLLNADMDNKYTNMIIEYREFHNSNPDLILF